MTLNINSEYDMNIDSLQQHKGLQEHVQSPYLPTETVHSL